MNHKIIKKSLYGKSQFAKVICPPGFGEVALKEVTSILADLWQAQPFKGEIALIKNEIHLRHVYMHALVEIMARSRCISDIRLIILKELSIGKKAFEKKCREITWDHYLDKQMSVKIKVDSVSSKAFHEAGLRDVLHDIVSDYVSEVVRGDDTQETTCIYADLYKDKLTVSVSLAGKSLYQRGYRGNLVATAPLREDMAACCIKKLSDFSCMLPETVFIPFSGTGTFAFEYLQEYFAISPVVFGRHYALEKMPFFNKESFRKLVDIVKQKLSSMNSESNLNIVCNDYSPEASAVLLDNKKRFNFLVHDPISYVNDNFFNLDLVELFSETSDMFILLNPPYGLRLNKNADTVSFYKKIALKLNELSSLLQKSGKKMGGVILCPNEETWSAFSKKIVATKLETYHFTQGGLDIRACQFI